MSFAFTMPACSIDRLPLVVTKLDLPEVAERWPELRRALAADGDAPIGVSAHDGTGLDELRARLASAIADAAIQEDEHPDREMRVHRFDPLAEGWEVVAEGDGFRVRGRRLELQAARTNFENEESRDRFWRLLERLGVDLELRRAGASAGSTVHVGPIDLEWGEDD